MTQLKVNFCNKLLGGKSNIIHRLGDVVNCREVYEKYGNERKYKVKNQKKKRKRLRPVRPEVSNFVEDEPIEGVEYYTTPEQETEYFYEDIVEEVSEDPWKSQEESIPPGKSFETETYYVTDDLVAHSPTPAPLHPHHAGFQYEISHPKSSGQNANNLPITTSTSTHHYPAPHHSQSIQPFGQTEGYTPTSSPSPAGVHWEPSSYDTNPPAGSGGSGPTTTLKTTNTYNWPSHTWDNTWPSSTPATVSKSFNTDNNKGHKIISWQNNSWTTKRTTRRTTTASTVPHYWQTEAPVREITSKSVLATPSDPTAPLVETATFSSNPWPSQFSSDLLGKVGTTQTVRTPDVSGPQKKRDEILKKNYFFTPSPTPLHLRNGINKIPSFESEFTAFGSDAHKSTFSSFDTNFDTTGFGDDSKRLKKEIKSSDTSDDADTYYHYGHHDSSAFASEGYKSEGPSPVKSNVLRDEHKKDIVQLYIPDPLAPGHPQGNGNHGWAPIEEWAEAQLRENLETPSWADSRIPSANSIIDWSDKTQPKTRNTPNTDTTVKKWTSPAPVLVRSTTVRPETVTVTQSEVSTMRPPPSPVTPLYSTNFGNYASLDVKHVGGPTGAPGLALFSTVAPPVQPHSNSHYMEQNPFIVSPVTPATAAAIKRNIDPADFWSYNPVTEASSVKSYSPLPRNSAWDSTSEVEVPATGYSYKTSDWPKSGLSTGYDNFHF